MSSILFTRSLLLLQAQRQAKDPQQRSPIQIGRERACSPQFRFSHFGTKVLNRFVKFY